jgi:protein-L-isoaspartate(D-aspartate) O-methyltransferase
MLPMPLTLEDSRRFYAEEIRFAAHLNSPALVEAFARVPREKYLGPGPWQVGSPEIRSLALIGLEGSAYITVDDPRHLYHNVVAVLDGTRDLNNGQPSALARWIDALDLKAGERVYHLGAGVGYYSAIMAEVVSPGGSVVASEVHPELAARAQKNLSSYGNVTVHAGDGGTFDPGPCDAILINAGVTHPHPLWLERLREGGRLLLPLTMAISPAIGQGIMVKIVRERGGFSARVVTPLGLYSCTSMRDPQLEPVIAKAFASRALFKIKSVRHDAHEPAETCLLHRSDVCMSSAELAS